ncbi:hypothetical protein KSD_17950 [Ktedonobacter sp. SOSP1-85]|nr:hypothetical protein KSD_17950 [Ktedonobacter sp. SOSP1-85]
MRINVTTSVEAMQKKIQYARQRYSKWLVERLRPALLWLFSEAARPIRFVCIGGSASLIQLCLLDLFLQLHIHAWLANIVAFFLAAQFNFLFSSFFTWRDRTVSRSGKLKPGAQFIKRWSTFHSSILVTALLNQLVFMLAGTVVPSLWASALGILVAACVNFFVMNRLVFRQE